MPRQLASYSERFGLFGMTLALIGWLLGVALIVAATAVTATLDRAQDLWARQIRRVIGVEAVAVPAVSREEILPTGQGPSPSSLPPPQAPIAAAVSQREIGLLTRVG